MEDIFKFSVGIPHVPGAVASMSATLAACTTMNLAMPNPVFRASSPLETRIRDDQPADPENVLADYTWEHT